MTFDLSEMRAVGGPMARIVVASAQGSAPREVGASMLVTESTTSGTIGGGALEFEAVKRARAVLVSGEDRLDRIPLGPGLGQCCGGAVTLLTEFWDSARLDQVDTVVARPLPGVVGEMPLAVKRVLSQARNSGRLPAPAVIGDWMVESVTSPEREIWVWGAGHVGRALTAVLAPIPSFRVLWVDKDRERFPRTIPTGVETLFAENPAELVTLSGPNAEHFVLTFSHALDLEICHRVLGRPFRFLGLIGSKTKRARFRKRLAALGHSAIQVDRMTCPIGDPALGKHPQAIALGVATALVKADTVGTGAMEVRA